MGEVISFGERKKTPPSFNQLVELALVDIDGNWARFAKINRLNDYFRQSVPSWTKEGIDYLSDLNELALIENKIDMTDHATALGKAGWIASFQLLETPVFTPALHTEAAARAFNILLFLKLRRDTVVHGLI